VRGRRPAKGRSRPGARRPRPGYASPGPVRPACRARPDPGRRRARRRGEEPEIVASASQRRGDQDPVGEAGRTVGDRDRGAARREVVEAVPECADLRELRERTEDGSPRHRRTSSAGVAARPRGSSGRATRASDQPPSRLATRRGARSPTSRPTMPPFGPPGGGSRRDTDARTLENVRRLLRRSDVRAGAREQPVRVGSRVPARARHRPDGTFRCRGAAPFAGFTSTKAAATIATCRPTWGSR
jgi:hypothetical protein